MSGLEGRILTLIKDLEEEKRLADKRAKQLYNLAGGAVPVGTIVPYLGGYFTDGVNGGFTMVMATANTVAAVNTLLNPSGFYVCDGAALNLGGSPIFNGAGRYLPKLTDDRFIMGDTLGGTPGGDNAMAHTHSVTSNVSVNNHTLTETQMPTHHHYLFNRDVGNDYMDANDYPMWRRRETDDSDYLIRGNLTVAFCGRCSSTGGGGAHSHGATNNAVTSGAASNTENRPKYLGCFYIMRAI